MRKLTERQTIKISKEQKKTLIILQDKYKINVSQFIREAIQEKLIRDKDAMLRDYKEVKKYLNARIPF